MMNLKPLTGASRMSSMRNIRAGAGGGGRGAGEGGFIYRPPAPDTRPPLSGCALAALQFEADVDEVVGGPRARVLEGELALVLGGDVFDLVVELGLAVALDEEGGVHDHLVADGLVGARGDRRVAERVVDVADVGVGLLGERA